MEEQAEQFIKEFREALGEYGPKGLESAISAAWLDAAGIIFTGIACLLGLAILLYGLFYCVRKGAEADRCEEEKWVAGAIVCGVASFMFLLGTLVNLFYMHAWLGLFNPEAFFIYKFVL